MQYIQATLPSSYIVNLSWVQIQAADQPQFEGCIGGCLLYISSELKHINPCAKSMQWLHCVPSSYIVNFS